MAQHRKQCLHKGAVTDTGKFDDLNVFLMCTDCKEVFAMDKIEFEERYDCDDDFPDWDDDFEDDEQEFQECSNCDGHPACEDFGCAYEHGLGNLVKNETP